MSYGDTNTVLSGVEWRENPISKEVVDAAYKIHSQLGPGLLESVYEVILAHEVRKRGLQVQRQIPVPIVWEDVRLEEGYRLDLMVGNKVWLKSNLCRGLNQFIRSNYLPIYD